MTNLQDDFLQDLLDLEEEQGEEQKNEFEELGEEEIPEMVEHEEPGLIEEVTEKDRIQQKRGVSNLLVEKEFLRHMEKLEKYSQLAQESQKSGTKYIVEDEEYQIITKSTEYVSVIDREIANIHKFIRDIYIAKFPELETLILNPIEYVNCVLAIKNETVPSFWFDFNFVKDMNTIDLSPLLSQHTIMAVILAGSSTTGKPLPEKDLKRCLDACEVVLHLDSLKKKILKYIESRMYHLAPNLCEITGSTTAAALISAAGGLEALARMPACNIQVLGAQRRNLLGFSKIGQKTHLGLFGAMEMVKKAPKDFQIKLARILSTNCAKASRVDASRMCPDGSIGREIKEKMLKRFDKIQEPAPGKLRKPLPAPEDKPKKRRGGKRYRKMKEKMNSEVRKYANRLKFGEEGAGEFRETGRDFGMLGVAGVKLKINKKTNVSLSKKAQANLAKNMGGQTGGFTSTILIDSNQGMQLYNPDFVKKATSKQHENYFAKDSGFRTVLQSKQQTGSDGFSIPLTKNQ